MNEFHTSHFTDEATEIQSNWLNSHHPTLGASHDSSRLVKGFNKVGKVVSASLTTSVTVCTWMMPRSLSRPDYPIVHTDNFTGTFWRLSRMQLLLCLSCFSSSVLSRDDMWSYHCNVVVEAVTLELAWWGLNSDSVTYVTLEMNKTAGGLGMAKWHLCFECSDYVKGTEADTVWGEVSVPP